MKTMRYQRETAAFGDIIEIGRLEERPKRHEPSIWGMPSRDPIPDYRDADFAEESGNLPVLHVDSDGWRFQDDIEAIRLTVGYSTVPNSGVTVIPAIPI